MNGPRNDPPQAGRQATGHSVGDRLKDGAVSGGVRGQAVWVNCALLGTGVTVDLTANQAEEFGYRLLEWARQVRSANRKP